MAADDTEEKLPRSVALQNVYGILIARQRAERELIEAKEALERKTEELAAKEELKVLEVRNIRRENFDKDKPIEEKTGAMTFAEWGKKYPYQQGVKNKRSLNEEKGMIRLYLAPFFGSMPLTQLTRESLIRYIDKRMGETILRQGKAYKKRPRAARSRTNFPCCAEC